jgi:hypothetical protein
MRLDDLGHRALVDLCERQTPLQASVQRAIGIGALTKVGAASTFIAMGASPVATLVGSLSMGIVASKLSANLPERDESGMDLSKVKLSLNVGEAVIFPLVAGMLMVSSRDTPQAKTDAIALLAAAALGTGVTCAVLASKGGDSA